MSEKKINLSDRQELLIVILLGICGVIIWNIYYNSFEKLYTIGIVVDTQSGKTSGTSVIYDFYYKEKKYSGSTGKGYYEAKKGDEFIVEFGKDKHSVSSILLYYPIPDTLEIKAPGSGWSKIPDEIIKYRLKIKGDFGLREYFHKDK